MRDSSRRRYLRFRRDFFEKRLATMLPQAESARGGLRRYFRWLKGHWGAISGNVTLALVVAGLESLHPLFLKHIVDGVLLPVEMTTEQRLRALHWAGGIFLAVVVVGQLLQLMRNYHQRQLNVRLTLSLRRQLYERILHLPVRTLHEMKTGGVISRVTSDVDTTTGLLQLALISPGVSAVRLLIAFGILFALNWRLALTALAVLPGIALVSFWSARRIRPIYRDLRKDAAAVDARVSEAAGGIRVVRAFQRERRELLAFSVGRHTMVRKQLFAHRRELVLWTAWGLMLAAVNVIIVWFGGYLQITSTASVGDIMAFQWYTFMLLTPVWQIVNSFSELQRSLAAMERVFEILAMPPEMPDQPAARPAPTVVEELRFEGVSFGYGDGEAVLHDIDVAVPGGSVVALVGRSGAGKSTMVDLVARLHDPTRGRVTLNGTDLRDYTLRSYRERLGVVQQDVFLFDGTIAENIRYGRQGATDAEIEEAARRANADEFVTALPDGYDTVVGERGVKLSGGQCQRLSIARAILAAPQILILDEATSALDTESEQAIQGALRAVFRGRTTFVVAHRLSTITTADLILVLDGGRIVERGRHADLMARRGAYYQMVQRQHRATRGDPAHS